MWIITSPSVSTLLPESPVAYVTGGLAIAIPHGPGVPYFYDNNVAPTVGVRFAF